MKRQNFISIKFHVTHVRLTKSSKSTFISRSRCDSVVIHLFTILSIGKRHSIHMVEHVYICAVPANLSLINWANGIEKRNRFAKKVFGTESDRVCSAAVALAKNRNRRSESPVILTDEWWHWRRDARTAAPNPPGRAAPGSSRLALPASERNCVCSAWGKPRCRWLSDPDNSPGCSRNRALSSCRSCWRCSCSSGSSL